MIRLIILNCKGPSRLRESVVIIKHLRKVYKFSLIKKSDIRWTCFFLDSNTFTHIANLDFHSWCPQSALLLIYILMKFLECTFTYISFIITLKKLIYHSAFLWGRQFYFKPFRILFEIRKLFFKTFFSHIIFFFFCFWPWHVFLLQMY